MTWRTWVLDRLGVRLHRLPPIERIDMYLPGQSLTYQAPPGRGWRCADCADVARYAVVWPPGWHGFYCDAHCPDPWHPGPPRVVGPPHSAAS